MYDADGFCEKNRDVLFKDCIALLKGSTKYVGSLVESNNHMSLFVAVSYRVCSQRILRLMSVVDQLLLVLRLRHKQMI